MSMRYDGWVAGLALCFLSVGCGAHEGAGDGSTDVFEQVVLVVNEDGTIKEHVIKSSRKIFQRELAWKQLASAAAELGEQAPAPPDRSSDAAELGLSDATSGEVDGVGESRQALYWADDVMPNCYGNTMWLTSSRTGNFLPENTFCMKKNTVGGVGMTFLFDFYMSATNPACDFNDYRVAACTRAWWSGEDPGVFRQYGNGSGSGPNFGAYQLAKNASIGNWPNLGFN